jgi:hypothetical protein
VRHIPIPLLFCLLLAVNLPRRATAQAPPYDASVNAPETHISLPMKYVKKHLFVELDDIALGPLLFMVDTGAENTLLSFSKAEKARIENRLFDRFVSITGLGNGKSTRIYGHFQLSLRTGTTRPVTAEALVVDRAGVELNTGRPVDGVLGWDFFQHWCVRLDYGAKRMDIAGLEHCSPPQGAYRIVKGKWTPEGMLLPSTLTLANGRLLQLQLHLDTGCDASLLLNPRLRDAAGLPRDPSTKGNVGKGMSGSYSTDTVTARELVLEGGYPKWSGRSFTLLIGRPGSFSKPHWWWDGFGEVAINRDGLLGNQLLESESWTFDPARKLIYVRSRGTSNR